MTNLKIVLFVTFGSELIISIIRPLVSQYASILGAGTFEVGLLASSYALLPFLLAVVAGRMTDLVGNRLPVIAGASGLVLGLAIPFAFPSLWGLYISQLIVGASQLIALIALQNITGSSSTAETRDHWFGLFAMSASAGTFLGPVVGGYVAEHISFPAAYLLASVTGALVVLIALRLSEASGSRASPRSRDSGTFALLKNAPLRRALGISALVLYSRDIFMVYFPLFAMHAGLSSSTIGWLIGAQAIALFFVRLYLGKLTLVLGRERVLIGSILLAGVSFIAIPLTPTVLLLALLSASIGLGLGCGQPLSVSTAFTVAPKDRTAEVLGLRLASNRLSQTVAPLFFGMTGAWLGLLSVFYLSGAFLIGGALLARGPKDDPVEPD
jgi:MFS family permease